MDTIRRQVSKARRRLVLQQFLSVLPWSIFATLLIAAMALAIPKIWPLAIDRTYWTSGWIGGSLVTGVLIAALWTYLVRRRLLDAALEIDRLFGLKERVSSSLALTPEERQTEVGRALLEDTERRVGRLDVSERISVHLTWRSLLPLAPALLIAGLMLLVGDATRQEAQGANSSSAQMRQQVKNSTAQLQKKLQEKKKQAEAQGLKDAEELLIAMQKGLERLTSKDEVDRKDALIKLNDLSKEIEQRRQQLSGSEEIKKQLEKLKDLQKGPADRVAQALQEGKFDQAMQELNELKKKLENGELTQAEKEQLAKQLDEAQQKLEDLVQAHEQAKQELEQRIEQLKKSGDYAAAAQLQQKLDRLQQQDAQMSQLQQMASKLGNSSKALKEGDAKQAAQALDQVANDLQQLQQQMEELQTLDEVMEQVADAKSAMGCQSCNGEGCAMCQGDAMGGMMGNMFGQNPGNGLGEGQGYGDRPEERTDTGHYESRVAAQPKPGEAVRVGEAGGPNRAGQSREGVKEQIESELSQAADPVTTQRLSRSQREHAKEYFERVRRGE